MQMIELYGRKLGCAPLVDARVLAGGTNDSVIIEIKVAGCQPCATVQVDAGGGLDDGGPPVGVLDELC